MENAKPLRTILGLDLGQASDFSALAGIQASRQDEKNRAVWALPLLKRWTLGTPYPAIVQDMRDICAKLDKPVLVVDSTGCGQPVVDFFREANLPVAELIAVTITGGHEANRAAYDRWNVPKKDLVGAAQSCLQTYRIKAAKALREFETLKKELANFKVKINVASATESFEAWRERDHDDLVLAVALALWWGEMDMDQPLGDVIHIKTQPDGSTVRPPEEIRFPQIRFFPQSGKYQPLPAPQGELIIGAPDLPTQEEAAFFVRIVYVALNLEPPESLRTIELDDQRKQAVAARAKIFCRHLLP
jgi:hypothetical protein